MAERAYTITPLQDGGIVVTWTGLNAGDTGAPVEINAHGDRSAQGIGTFAGTTLAMQGSNEPTAPSNYFGLTDGLGASASLTAAGAKGLFEPSRWVRPSAGGGAATGLVAHLYARKTRGE